MKSKNSIELRQGSTLALSVRLGNPRPGSLTGLQPKTFVGVIGQLTIEQPAIELQPELEWRSDHYGIAVCHFLEDIINACQYNQLHIRLVWCDGLCQVGSSGKKDDILY